jgi:hypothetical protein
MRLKRRRPASQDRPERIERCMRMLGVQIFSQGFRLSLHPIINLTPASRKNVKICINLHLPEEFYFDAALLPGISGV